MSSLCVFASDADASRREASTGMHLFLGAVLLLYLVKSLVAQFSDDTFELTVGFYNVGIQLAEIGKKGWKK